MVLQLPDKEALMKDVINLYDIYQNMEVQNMEVYTVRNHLNAPLNIPRHII